MVFQFLWVVAYVGSGMIVIISLAEALEYSPLLLLVTVVFAIVNRRLLSTRRRFNL